MNRTLTSHNKFLKQKNVLAVLNILQHEHVSSRADIALLANLTPATVSNIVSRLVEINVVKFTGEGNSKGGRRPILLELNPKAFYVVGIDIGISYAIALVMDLHANIISRMKLNITHDMNREQVINNILDVTGRVISTSKVDRKKILGIGISFLGLIDRDAGIAIHAPNLPEWHNVPIVESFQKKFNVDTFIENNAKAMTLGEARFGNGRRKKYIFGVIIAEGIGSGIIIDGKLYTGCHSSAGEFGHMTMNPSGAACSCGNNGCLQALSSETAIEATASRFIKSGVRSTLNRETGKGKYNISIDEIVAAANQGDDVANQILHEAVAYIGIGLADIVNLLNPEIIILGGGPLLSYASLIDDLDKIIKKRAYTTELGIPEIRLSSLGENASCIGAATVVLDHTFSVNQ